MSEGEWQALVIAFVLEGPYVSEGMGHTVCSNCGAEEKGKTGLGLPENHHKTCTWVKAKELVEKVP